MAKDAKGHGSGGGRGDPFAAIRVHSNGKEVKGFKAPDYPAGGGATKGHVLVHHKGFDYFHTQKTGTHSASGEKSYEYGYRDDHQDGRIWVRKSGKVDEDSPARPMDKVRATTKNERY